MTNEKTKSRKDRQGSTRSSGRRRGFNALDVFLILLILCCVGLAVLAYLPGSGFLRKSDRAQITYVIEFEGVRPDFASYIREGDRVTSSEGCDLGTVAAGVEVGVYNVVRYDPATADVVSSAHPSLSNLLVTVSLTADSDPLNGYSSEGLRIAVGAELDCMFPGFTGRGTCISITENGTGTGGER